MLFKQILVALDLTEMDDFLLRYALFLVKKFKTEKVYFVHNIKRYDLPEAIDELLIEVGKPLEQLITEDLTEKIEGVFSESDIKPSILVKYSDSTAHTLTDVAEKLKVDTIVLGKKNAFKGTGLQVDKILRLTSQSVLLVPDCKFDNITNLVVPIDFSKHSKKISNIAQNIASTAIANLNTVHVYQLPRWFFPYIPEGKANISLLKDAEKSYQKLVASTDLENTKCDFLSGKDKGIAKTIQAYAVKQKADFLILGLKGKNQLTGFQLGSVAAKISQLDWHIPVLFVR
ncbi:MAG: nucleotide-binding universal stress UspA family protein [Cognaticolwellia sp.]|jgi:nucleotide-binding universal stress UspA family protein